MITLYPQQALSVELINEKLTLFVQVCNGLLISVCHLMALTVIAIGVIRALFIFVNETLLKQKTFEAFQSSRLMMGYSFSLGLSFLIGASILTTMVSSHWNDLAQLAIIIVIRTALNFLLERANKLEKPPIPALQEQL